MADLLALAERLGLGPTSVLCVVALTVVWRQWRADLEAIRQERRETSAVMREIAQAVRDHSATLAALQEAIRELRR